MEHKGLAWALVIVLIALAALACNLGETTARPTETVSPATMPDSPPADEGRYANTEGGFSLVLPEGWSVLGPLAVTVPETGAGYSLYVLGAAPTESAGPGASMIVIADAAQLTIQEFSASQCYTCPQNHSEEAMLGTVPAERLRVGGGTVPFDESWFFVEHHGRRIGLAVHDPDTPEPLNEVLAALRLEAE